MITIRHQYDQTALLIVQDCTLIGADLRKANLQGANLRKAKLQGANLQGVQGLPDVPCLQNPDSAVLAVIQSGGTLDMGHWHSCGTSHCYAGWLITLTGARGKRLEDAVGTETAACLVFAASKPGHETPNFYASTGEAMLALIECARDEVAS